MTGDIYVYKSAARLAEPNTIFCGCSFFRGQSRIIPRPTLRSGGNVRGNTNASAFRGAVRPNSWAQTALI